MGLPGKRQKEKQVLTIDEAKKIINQGIYHVPLKEYLMIVMSLVYSSRHGELAALTWDDIDFKRGVIYITKTVTSQHLSETTKTGRDNILPMLPQIAVLLRELKKGQSEEQNLLNLVFPSRVRGRYREAPSINYNIRKLAFHDYNHD